jgi:NAD(P)H-dependent FMN reductase
MSGASLIALGGSLRLDSFNHRLVEIAAEGAREAGAKVNVLRLRDLDLPIYDADFEDRHGLPPDAKALKATFAAADGMLVASPEYNGSVSAALKNAIDWISRPEGEETIASLVAFRGKVGGVMSASIGPWGGIRGLAHIRQILSGLFVTVIGEQLAIPMAQDAFEGTELKNQAQGRFIRDIGRRTAVLAATARTL